MCYKLLMSNCRQFVTTHGISIYFFHSTLVFNESKIKNIGRQILLLHHFKTSTMMDHSALNVSSLIRSIIRCPTSCAQGEDSLNVSNTRLFFNFYRKANTKDICVTHVATIHIRPL